jgi:hypothetical protein
MTNTTRRPTGDEFPCASLAEALPHLRRPPTAEAVRFKIQTVAGELAQIAPPTSMPSSSSTGSTWSAASAGRPSSSRCRSRFARARLTETAR